MLSAAVSAHTTLGALVLGAAYTVNRLLRWQERRSMIEKAPSDQMVELARAFNAPTFLGRTAAPGHTPPVAE